MRAVLVDDPRVKLLHAAADRLIVIADEIHFIALAADLNPACGIDLVAPQLVAAHEPERVDVKRTGLRGGKADGDSVFGQSRRDKGRRRRCSKSRGGQKKGKRKQPLH